jgi:glyoxylase-like metal-dependent hydrolase (beta-lactamase superfamily II)
MPVSVKVHPMVGADMKAPEGYWKAGAKGVPNLLKTFMTTPRGKWLTMPIPAFLLEHPERGPVLVDTAFDPVVATDRKQSFGRIGALMFTPEKVRPVSEQLRERGIEPGDVKTIVMTHLHFDHASGIGQFPDAEYVVEQREWQEASDGGLMDGYFPAHLAPARNVTKVDVAGAPAADGFPHVHDVFGDGSVRMAFTPGHTHGHCSILLETAGGPMLLCGDAAYARKAIDERWEPIIIGGDKRDYHATLELLAAWIEAHPGAPVICGHDPWNRADLERDY